MMPYYENCDVISAQNKKITEISHQQKTVTQKYKTTCITLLKVFSHKNFRGIGILSSSICGSEIAF